uniref:Universal stress protein 9308 n=1 Tax=Hordeum vulgare subsp. vulgare TaxID=112509 RepID=D2XV83_HORVV|nr:universal stress protein 9308 [Hordeum vulgare subsp. vulgare]
MEEASAEAVAMASGMAPGAEVTTMKVVAAVDASEESLHALSWALDNVVRHHPGASVVVVHAQHPVDHFVYPVAAHGLAYAPPTAMDSMRRAQAENSRKAVARALDVCRQKQVSATAAVVEGDAKEAICQAVEDARADLLVLGSRGLGMIKRALLGSVSDYLAHHASCPVLIVKPPNKAHHK